MQLDEFDLSALAQALPKPEDRPPQLERIWLSWSESCDVGTYIDTYLAERRLPGTADWRDRARAAIAGYTGTSPSTKAALDYFLDANLRSR